MAGQSVAETLRIYENGQMLLSKFDMDHGLYGTLFPVEALNKDFPVQNVNWFESSAKLV